MAYESSSSLCVAELIVDRGEPTLIVPAEETEKGLYFLSNFDQNAPVNVSTVYCFKSEKNGDKEAAEVIKNALSKLLVPYFPFAGRLRMDSEGKLVVECNGEGAVFVEAQANCSIEEIGDDSVPLGKLAFDAPQCKNILEEPPLAVQVTKFKNGGFSLGLCMNHCILDGRSAMEFIKSWGEIARGLPPMVNLFMDRTILKARNPPKVEFPHHEFSEIEDISNTSDLYSKEELLYKSFFFDPEKLEKLRKAAKEDGCVDKCSTFEALSAFVWRARAQAMKLRHDQNTKLVLIVDGRSRFDPPLPENYFGNCVTFASSIASASELIEKPLSFAVRQVQEAIKMVTDSYLRSAIDCFELTRARPSLSSTFLISTMRRLPFDAIDFGWGNPILAGCAFLPMKEGALFLPHPKGKQGVNVLLGLPASCMRIFQELMHI